jgi:cob(I)alamin adenosyltransferase
MAELATAPENRHKLSAGSSATEATMVDRLEAVIDAYSARFEPPTQFVVPGEDLVASYLDLARTVVRRAERESLSAASEGSFVVPYLNRLSDLLWTLARWQEGDSLNAKQR